MTSPSAITWNPAARGDPRRAIKGICIRETRINAFEHHQPSQIYLNLWADSLGCLVAIKGASAAKG